MPINCLVEMNFWIRGKLFLIPKLNRFKYTQNPMFRAMREWNTLDVGLRNAPIKDQFVKGFVSQIENPYKK